MSSLPYISYETKLRSLMEAGIVPEWMYRECTFHGMDTAEDFLCEWDWEWGWDLGYGYTDSQLAILKEARQTVRQGIEEFLRNPDLQKLQREKEEAQKKAEQLYAELTKKLCPPLYAGEILPIVNHVMKYGEEPLFTIFYRWFKRHQHSDRNKIRLFMAGVYDGQKHTPKETHTLQQTGELKEKYGIETQFSLGSIRHSASTRYEIKGRLSYLIPALRLQLAEYLRHRVKSEESDVKSQDSILKTEDLIGFITSEGSRLEIEDLKYDTARSADTTYCAADTHNPPLRALLYFLQE